MVRGSGRTRSFRCSFRVVGSASIDKFTALRGVDHAVEQYSLECLLFETYHRDLLYFACCLILSILQFVTNTFFGVSELCAAGSRTPACSVGNTTATASSPTLLPAFKVTSAPAFPLSYREQRTQWCESSGQAASSPVVSNGLPLIKRAPSRPREVKHQNARCEVGSSIPPALEVGQCLFFISTSLR